VDEKKQNGKRPDFPAGVREGESEGNFRRGVPTLQGNKKSFREKGRLTFSENHRRREVMTPSPGGGYPGGKA